MYTRTINIEGPAGNAYSLMATAQHMARDFGEDGKKIVSEMKESGDYDMLIQTFLFFGIKFSSEWITAILAL